MYFNNNYNPTQLFLNANTCDPKLTKKFSKWNTIQKNN